MSRTGSVEHAIVVGIFAVIVTILGIAVWGALTSDGVFFNGATDGGAPTTKASSEGTPMSNVPQVVPSQLGSKLTAAEEKRQEQLRKQRDAAKKVLGPRSDTGRGRKPGQGAAGLVARGGREVTEAATAVPSLKRNGDPLARSTEPKAEGAAPVKLQDPFTSVSVQAGDSIWKIAKRHYGDGDLKRMVDLILEHNPEVDPDLIYPGQELKLPRALPPDVQTKPLDEGTGADTSGILQTQEGGRRKYEVQEGDSLEQIAQRELGDRTRWMEIWELNRQYLEAPEKIYPGKTLLLPVKLP